MIQKTNPRTAADNTFRQRDSDGVDDWGQWWGRKSVSSACIVLSVFALTNPEQTLLSGSRPKPPPRTNVWFR